MMNMQAVYNIFQMRAVSEKRNGNENIYFRFFGTMVRISSICKEGSFSHQSFVSTHMA